MLHIPPTKILRSKNNQEPQTSPPFGKWRIRGKKVSEWAKSRKG